MTIKAYMIMAVFGEGPRSTICFNAAVGPSPEGAATAVATAFVQQTGESAPLSALHVQELAEDFLVAALAAIRGQNGSAQIVVLRPADSASELPPAS